MNLGRSCRFRTVICSYLLVALAVLGVPWTLSLADNVLVFPQVAVGGGYISFITLMDEDFNTPVNGTLFIYNSDGSPRSVAMNGQPTGSQFPVTIPPGGTVVLTTTDVGGNVSGGMAKFVSDLPAGGVARFQFPGGEVGVVDSPRRLFATLPVATSGGNDTGLAISNSGTSPVNIRLVYADGNGTSMQTVDPPALNPLPVNGQVAAFASQFGLTQAENQSTGTIQIQTTSPGGFHALALLLKGGLLSSTAVVDGASGFFDVEQFRGSFTGTFHDNSTGTDTPVHAEFAPVEADAMLFFHMTFDATFLRTPGTAEVLAFGPYDRNGFTISFPSASNTFTMTVSANGTMTTTSTDTKPADPIASFNCSGQAHSEGSTSNCVVTFKDSTTKNVTLTLHHTNQ
ncbi:MAG: hypothetical protein WBN92_21030 [Terriglobia bacterium]